MNIHLDMYQTLAVAVLVLMLGSFLRKKIHFLGKILYSGTRYRRSALCDFHLYLLQYRSCRIFL